MSTKIFFAVYKTIDNLVVLTRTEMADNANKIDATGLLSVYCQDHNLNPADYSAAELSSPLPENILHGKYVYDSATNSIIVAPNWIEPPAVETSSISVSDPNGGAQ